MVDASSDMVRASRGNVAAAGLSSRISVMEGAVEHIDTVAPGPYSLIYAHDTLHHWEDPRVAFTRIRSILAPEGMLVLGDERRNIGIGATILVACVSRLLGPMSAFRRSSIAAGYTAAEATGFLDAVAFSEHRAKEEFFDLFIVAKR